MAFYGPARFYPVIGSSHADVVRLAAKIVRRATVLVDDQPVFDLSENGPVSAGRLSKDMTVVVLDDRAHVLTVSVGSTTAQFSAAYEEVAVECALNGWLEVKR